MAQHSLSKHIGGLDGLRALAIILVLLYHLTPGKNSDRGLESIVFKIADIGWLGVDLFFVLSGFLITSILLKYKREGRPLRSYFVKRLLRIMPIYFFVLILVFFLVPLLTNLYEFPSVSNQLPFWLYVSNYFWSAGGDYNEYFELSHFWSLGVEMQFYLIWPLLIKYIPENRLVAYTVVLLVCAVLVGGLMVLYGVDWLVICSWTPLRMYGLLIGSMIAIYHVQGLEFPLSRTFRNILIAILGMLIASVAWYHMGSLWMSPETIAMYLVRILLPLFASMFFGLLLIEALGNNIFSRLMSVRLLAFIAKYSYGIYVVHFLFIAELSNYLLPVMKNHLGDTDAAIYAFLGFSSLFSVILAVISYHLLERPFLLLKNRI